MFVKLNILFSEHWLVCLTYPIEVSTTKHPSVLVCERGLYQVLSAVLIIAVAAMCQDISLAAAKHREQPHAGRQAIRARHARASGNVSVGRAQQDATDP